MKHVTTANKDDKLVSLRAEFGMWGIGTYWTLVELTAEKISEKTESAEAILIVSELLGFFGCKRNKLETFLEHSQNIQLFNYTINGNILKINIPKLLEYADNYIKYDGKSLKTLQRQNQMSSKQDIDIDKEEDKKKSTTYTEDSQEMFLAKYLFASINLNDPKAKKPDFQKWASDADKILRLDKRTMEEIKQVIDFCQSDSFWKSNILSMSKLREKFQQLYLKMKANKDGSNTKPNSTVSRATFKHGEAEKQRLRELQATLEQRDRDRNIRSRSNSE